MFYRLFLLFLITYLVIKVLRALFRKTPPRPRAEKDPGIGVDPRSIRDAEFTEVQDPDEGQR